MLWKNSYVNTQKPVSIALESLRPYGRDNDELQYVLTRDSYQQLIKHAIAKPPVAGISPLRSNDQLLAKAEANTYSASISSDHQRAYNNMPRVAMEARYRNNLWVTEERERLPWVDYLVGAVIWSIDTILDVACGFVSPIHQVSGRRDIHRRGMYRLVLSR